MSKRAPEIQVEVPQLRKFLARLALLAVPLLWAVIAQAGPSPEIGGPVAHTTATSGSSVRLASSAGPDRGGMVQAEDGTWVPRKFYDRTDYDRSGVADQREVHTSVPEAQPRKSVAKQEPKPRKVVAVDHGTVSRKCWSALRAAGFKGKAGDGREAIYVPSKRLAELCGSKTDRKPSVKVKAEAKAEKAAARKSVVAEDGSRVKPGFYDRTDYNADGITDQDQGWSKNPNPDDVKAGRK